MEAQARLYVERIAIDRGGYDRRGRYWSTGAPLFRVTDDHAEIDYHVRAVDRRAAVAMVRAKYPTHKTRG